MIFGLSLHLHEHKGAQVLLGLHFVFLLEISFLNFLLSLICEATSCFVWFFFHL